MRSFCNNSMISNSTWTGILTKVRGLSWKVPYAENFTEKSKMFCMDAILKLLEPSGIKRCISCSMMLKKKQVFLFNKLNILSIYLSVYLGLVISLSFFLSFYIYIYIYIYPSIDQWWSLPILSTSLSLFQLSLSLPIPLSLSLSINLAFSFEFP